MQSSGARLAPVTSRAARTGARVVLGGARCVGPRIAARPGDRNHGEGRVLRKRPLPYPVGARLPVCGDSGPDHAATACRTNGRVVRRRLGVVFEAWRVCPWQPHFSSSRRWFTADLIVCGDTDRRTRRPSWWAGSGRPAREWRPAVVARPPSPRTGGPGSRSLVMSLCASDPMRKVSSRCLSGCHCVASVTPERRTAQAPVGSPAETPGEGRRPGDGRPGRGRRAWSARPRAVLDGAGAETAFPVPAEWPSK